MIEQTIQKLKEMKMHGFARALEEQLSNPAAMELSFEERISLLVDQEENERMNRKIQRLLKAAKFAKSACVEDIDFRHDRGLKRSEIASLSTCTWIQRANHLILTGPTGTGKTWLACALGNRACRSGLSVRFYKMVELLRDMSIAKHDGSYKKMLARLIRYDLLILDDFGAHPMEIGGKSILYEIVDGREERGSIIVTSQLPVGTWHKFVGGKNGTIGDATLDRLIGGAYRIELSGDSFRRRRKVELD